jgi:hypothetical protein
MGRGKRHSAFAGSQRLDGGGDAPSLALATSAFEDGDVGVVERRHPIGDRRGRSASASCRWLSATS